MEEEGEDDDLPEIEEDEIHVEDDLWQYNEECRNDKEAIGDDELHPKLIPLLISLVFMLISFTLVSWYHD